MIYLELFLTFLEVGAVSFGGGYAMISLIREKVLTNGWLTEGELLNMIAVSESTPGPIAVNMATFVGSKQGGILGSCGVSLALSDQWNTLSIIRKMLLSTQVKMCVFIGAESILKKQRKPLLMLAEHTNRHAPS